MSLLQLINNPVSVVSLHKKKKKINWSKVINDLEDKELVDTRMTDHQYRKDPRNITFVKGFPLNDEVGVGELSHHVENECSELAVHLINLLGIKGNKIPRKYLD